MTSLGPRRRALAGRVPPYVRVFVLLWLIAGAWSLAMPRYAAPDEPAHVRKAAATGRAQLFGHTLADEEDWLRRFDLPSVFEAGDPACFATKRDQAANCQVFAAPYGVTQAVNSTAGTYPPLYYVVPGVASLVTDRPIVVYLMRLASAALCAAFLALAFTWCRRTREPRLAALGVLVACTPMVLFLAGMVNPNALEIAALAATWVGAYVVFTQPGAEQDRRFVAAVAAVAAVGVLSRQWAAAWIAAAAVVLAIVAGRERLKAVVRARPVRFGALAVVAAGVVQLAYLLGSGSFKAPYYPALAQDAPFSELLRTTNGDAWANVKEMVGNFGWLDTPAPALTLVLWLLALGAVVGLAVALGRRRVGVALGLLALAVWLVPLYLEAKEAPTSGFYWQGRYGLPLAVGIPIVAGLVVASHPLAARLAATRLRVLAGAGLVAAQVVAFYWALHRFVQGDTGPFLLWPGTWHPPVPALLLIVVHAVATALLAAGCLTAWGASRPVRGGAATASLAVDDDRTEPVVARA